MKDYIFSVISFAAFATASLGILPCGEGVLKKTFLLLLSLIMILVIGSPLVSMVKDLDISLFSDMVSMEAASYEAVWLETLETLTENEVEAAVLRLVSDEYSLDKNDITVDCILKKEENSFSLEKVEILLSGKGRFVNPSRVESFIYEKLNCECKVR